MLFRAAKRRVLVIEPMGRAWAGDLGIAGAAPHDPHSPDVSDDAMHELSIALSIIDVAGEELERQGGGVVEAIHLRLGPLSGVVKEALLSAFEMAREQSPALASSCLIISDVPVEVFCRVCDARREVESIQDMRCRTCGTPSAQVVSGRELEVVALEICDEETTAVG